MNCLLKILDGIENLGLAVFKDYNLVGELNNIECVCYLILSNQLDTCLLSVPNIFEENSYIDISFSHNKSTKNDVKFINGAPYITSKIDLKAYFVSAEDNKNYMNDDILPQIEEYLNGYLESHISDFVYKTSKEFKSDIVGFGRTARTKYLTYQEWLESNWLNNYENAFFDINVSINIKSSYLFEKN